VRDARGRSRGESPAAIVATARAQRVKAGADPADALNALNGTTLGILHRRRQLSPTDQGGVSADQYNAAQAYIATVLHHAEIMGLPMPWPGGVASRPTRADPAEDVVLAVRRRFADLRRREADLGCSVFGSVTMAKAINDLSSGASLAICIVLNVACGLGWPPKSMARS
jgi:hypothetical protein